MMMLKITTGKEKGRTLELTADTPLTIGRSESSGFCIPDKKVSRRHAEIVSDGENVSFRFSQYPSVFGSSALRRINNPRPFL